MNLATDPATRAGAHLWVGLPGLRLGSEERAHLQRIHPGVVILFERNIESLPQVRDLIQELRRVVGPQLSIAVDQEGGTVVRFSRHLTLFPGNMALGAVAAADLDKGWELAYQQGVQSGTELRDLDIDINLAPCVDLALSSDNPWLGTRSFGASPERAARLAEALVAGHLASGVEPVLKHFPGLGEARSDSHVDLPSIHARRPADSLRPFRDGIDAGCRVVMTSHSLYRNLDPELPVTLSSRVVQGALRDQLGYSGVVVSDDLEMGAMAEHYSFPETVRGALSAGHDAICVAADLLKQVQAHAILQQGYAEGAGWLCHGEASQARLQGIRERSGKPPTAPKNGTLLARRIAESAVTLLSDPGWLPISPEQRPLVVLPATAPRGEDLKTLRQALTPYARFQEVALEPTSADLTTAARRSVESDLLVVVLVEAKRSPARRELARQALDWHDRVVFLLLGDPWDIEVLPRRKTCTILCGYGFRPVHQYALAQVLLGNTIARGIAPVKL